MPEKESIVSLAARSEGSADRQDPPSINFADLSYHGNTVVYDHTYKAKRLGGVEISMPCGLVHREKSAYQTIEVVDTEAFGRMLLLDGVVNTASRNNDVIHESLYAPALLAAEDPKRVLILGGGDLFGAAFALAWPGVESVTVVELDSQVVQVSKKHLLVHPSVEDDPRLSLVIGDAVRFVKETMTVWDVIILDMTDPFGISEGCYSLDFCQALVKIRRSGGVIATQCDSPDTIGDAYYSILRTYVEAFAGLKVAAYRMWIPAYLEFFGRILVAEHAGQLIPPLHKPHPNLTWLSPRMMQGMFHSAQELDILDKVRLAPPAAELGSLSVSEWEVK